MILLFPPPISLDIRATSLQDALPRLGAVYGTPMRAAPAIGGEIVIAALRGASAEDVRDRLAETFAAEWRTDRDGTLVLNRSRKLREAEAHASDARRTAQIGRGLARFRTWLAQNVPLTPEGLKTAGGFGRREMFDKPQEDADPKVRALEDPKRRLVLRVMASLNPNDFCSVGTRMVFASRPNARQRPFPGDAGAIARTYTDEVRAWSNLSNSPEIPTAPIATLLLSAEHRADDVSLLLTAFEGGGTELFTRQISVSSEDGTISDHVASTGGMSVTAVHSPKFEGPKFRFVLSPDSLAFVRAFGAGSGWFRGGRPALTEYTPFLDVVARDPLSFAATDVVLSLARETGRSVLVRGFDRALVAGEVGEKAEPMTPEEALGTRNIDRTRPGWILVRADDPPVEDTVAFERPSLREALQLGFADPAFSLATRVKIARLVPESPRYVPATSMVERLARMEGTISLYNPRVLRLLGAMSDLSPREIRFRDLGPEGRRHLESLVYGISPLRYGGASTSRPRAMSASEREPTLLLPNGLPPDGRLRIESDDEDSILVPDTVTGGESAMDLAAFAFLVYRMKHPALFAPENKPSPDFGKLGRIARTKTVIRFLPIPEYEAVVTIASQIPAEGPRFTLEALPADLRAGIDRWTREIEQTYKNAPPYEEGRRLPPP